MCVCVCVFYCGGCIINPTHSSSLRFFLSIVSLWSTAYGQFILSSILNGPFMSLIIITALMDVFPFQNIPLSWANLIKLHYRTVSLLPTVHHAGLPYPRRMCSWANEAHFSSLRNTEGPLVGVQGEQNWLMESGLQGEDRKGPWKGINVALVKSSMF